MKLSEKIDKLSKPDSPSSDVKYSVFEKQPKSYYSFEYFPPKTE